MNPYLLVGSQACCRYTNGGSLGGTKGIEPSLTVPQTVVLPLHYKPHIWLRGKGLNLDLIGYEPSVLPYTTSAILEWITGLEPVLMTWQAIVLPLYDTHIWHRCRDLNPDKQFWRLSCCRYTTPIFGTRRGDRTPDLVLVRHLLIPAELYGYISSSSSGDHS